MRDKLKLEIDDLRVETFETLAEMQDGGGTVLGHQSGQAQCSNWATWCGTCVGASCEDSDCMSCEYDTCRDVQCYPSWSCDTGCEPATFPQPCG